MNREERQAKEEEEEEEEEKQLHVSSANETTRLRECIIGEVRADRNVAVRLSVSECVRVRIMFLLASPARSLARSLSPQLHIGRHLCSLLHSTYLIAWGRTGLPLASHPQVYVSLSVIYSSYSSYQ